METAIKRKIAVIAVDMDEDYSAGLLSGIMQEAKSNHFDAYIFNAYVHVDETVKHNMGQYNIFTLINLSEFDGVVVYSNMVSGRDIYATVKKILGKTDIPVVGIDDPIDNHYCVSVENYESMKAVVEHFIVHHNFTKIDYISGQALNKDSQIRQKAYVDALQEHGIPVEEERIFQGTFSAQHGREAARELLASGGELPQAVVCANDNIALGFISVLNEYGIKVPEQIAVSGFDNIFGAKTAIPRLTTVDRNLEEVGREAVRMIQKHIAGEPCVKNEMFPAVPIFSESCGCEKADNGNDEELRNQYSQMVDHYEKYLLENNTMIEELNDCQTFSEFLKRLKNYVKELGSDRFYFCLDRELVDDLLQLDKTDLDREFKNRQRTEGFAPEMCVALAYEFGCFGEYGDFPTEQMLPWKDDAPEGDHHFIFSPVHFGDVCMGYVIVENSEFALTSPLYRTWLINLSNGLENLRKRANMRYVFEHLDKLYVTDYLTELYNRFGFARYTVDNFKQCIEEKTRVMILYADLDGLKLINDWHGHDKGDIALKAVADSLRGACEGNEICARFGGDEYVVYAPDYDEEKAKKFVGRFEQNLIYHNQTMGQPFPMNASYGYEIFVPAEGEEIDKYVAKADKKMYVRKKIRYTEEKAGTLIWQRESRNEEK